MGTRIHNIHRDASWNRSSRETKRARASIMIIPGHASAPTLAEVDDVTDELSVLAS